MEPTTVEQLERFGPDHCEEIAEADARAMCVRLARSHNENFAVLSRFVPADRHDDFAAVYAFCRWADDLGDEIGDPERSSALLHWWRDELNLCYQGEPRHPVFKAIAPTIALHDLPIEPFGDLISAFEQDQHVTRYETWSQLLEYCRLSANPVGRLVLMLLGEPRDEGMLHASDAICTALQLTNHWQDISRDIQERDRLYIPAELITIDDFESRLRGSAKQGYAVDQTFLPECRKIVRTLVERTWPLYEQGDALLRAVGVPSKPIIWLFTTGGQRTLRLIEHWNYETALHRPRIHAMEKAMLVFSTMLRAKFFGFNERTRS